MRLIYFYRLIQLSISIIRILVKMYHLVLSVSVGPLHSSVLVQSLTCVRLFATPRIAALQASLSITNSWSSLSLTSIESVMSSSHLILCRPLLLLPPNPSQHQDYEIMKLLRKYKTMNEKWWQTLSKMLIHFYHFRDQIIILPGGLKLRWNEVDSRHR